MTGFAFSLPLIIVPYYVGVWESVGAPEWFERGEHESACVLNV